MAIQETDREDLFRDARQFPLRLKAVLAENWPVRLGIGDFAQEMFIGVREAGGWSLYAGQQHVVHFNAQHEIRSIFWESRKMIAVQQQLVELSRPQQGGQVSFQRRSLSAAEQDVVLGQIRQVCDGAYAFLQGFGAEDRKTITGVAPDGATPGDKLLTIPPTGKAVVTQVLQQFDAAFAASEGRHMRVATQPNVAS